MDHTSSDFITVAEKTDYALVPVGSRGEDNVEPVVASFDALLDKTSEISALFHKQKLNKATVALLDKLKRNMLIFQAVLLITDSKQFTLDPKAREWLHELTKVRHEIEDLLDKPTKVKPRKASLCCFGLISPPFYQKKAQMKAIAEKTEYLVKQKELYMSIMLTSKFYQLSTEISGNEFEAIGRGRDEECVIKLLLSDSLSADQIDVVTIMGTSGVGKTTLAQLVYDDQRVDKHFDVKKWIYASDDVLQTLASQLSGIQAISKEKLLLVLDNVEFPNFFNWGFLKSSLTTCGNGSKIIVTTTRRNPESAAILGTLYTHRLSPLTDEDTWMLLAKHAFENERSSLYPTLEPIGKAIVKTMCYGLPLAAKVLGAALRFKLTVEEWVAVLKTGISNSADGKSGILSTLKLSYDYLPAHLKPCFVYCATFPKGYEFDEERVILWWMEKELLQPQQGDKTIEMVGRDYFRDLRSRCFFQRLSTNKSRFVMHDLFNQLVHFAYGENRSRKPLEIDAWPSKEMDFSFSEGEGKSYVSYKDLEKLYLSHSRIPNLLDSIGRLKTLRYIDLSNTAVTRLPDSIGALSSLQTLILSNCSSLTELPSTMSNLINLRDLLINGTGLKEMPEEMCKLTNLRTLSNFIVGKSSGSGINELGPLSNLRGGLHISQLQNLLSAVEASKASLKSKKNLDMLEMEWSNTQILHDQTEVLEQLQPHRNLKMLRMKFFNGTRFPDWLGDSYFPKMELLRLSNCNNCSHLPPLGQLPSLKHLSIEEMNRVERVGLDFYGVSSSIKPFQSLETLVFRGMSEWREWISPEGIEFPCLQKIYIQKCPKLKRSLPECINANNVEISECPEFETLPRFPVLDDLQLHDGNKRQCGRDDKLVHQPPRLPIIEEVKSLDSNIMLLKNDDESASQHPEHMTDASRLPVIEEVKSIDSNILQLENDDEYASQHPEHMNDVSIASCSSTPESFKSSTEDSNIKDGDESEIPPYETDISSDTDDPINIWYAQDVLQDTSSLESLKISEISQLIKLPPVLHSLKIQGCDALKSLPKELMGGNAHLQHLYIIDCCFLQSFEGDHLPTALKSLYIRNCRKLKFPSQHALLEDLCIGSSCDSLSSFPLTLFPKLRSLAIWDCANFSSISITKNHMSLDAMEIRDCPKLVSVSDKGLLTPKLTSILLSNCSNLNVLPDGLERLTLLESLFINGCPELKSIPEVGFPNNLNLLCITCCHELTPRIQWKMYDLNKLSCLEIDGGCKDLKSFPEQRLLPRSLNSLRISRLTNLEFLDYKGFEHLTSLETMKINGCDKLQSLPEEGLPSSVTYLYINECSLLKEKFQNRRGKEWHKIARIPHIQIDEEVISIKQDNVAGGIMAGGSLLSAYLHRLLDKLTSGEFVEFFLRGHKLVPLVRNLVETILTVNTVLDDADEKQFKNPAIRRWHNELIEVTYDLGDLMEEINTEALQYHHLYCIYFHDGMICSSPQLLAFASFRT